MNMVYQDLVKMQQNIVQAGERKYEYDSDEDTEVSCAVYFVLKGF